MESTETAAPSAAFRRPPLVIAHRAGNRLELLRQAERTGAHLIEADVRLFRGRAEVRHLKTLGPLPFYWDRWEVAPPWRRSLLLDELLAATRPATELMLDLKGSRRRLSELVVDRLGPYLGERRFTVCARSWTLLDAFAGLPVTCIHSVGNRRQLRALLRGARGEKIAGVSIHERLLDPVVVAELRTLAGLVLTWPVNRVERAAQLARLGVDGLITDDAGALTRSAVAGALA